MKPTANAIHKICAKRRATATEDKNLETLIETLNPIVTGWCNYYSCSPHSRRAFAKVDSERWETMWNWTRKTYSHLGAKEIFEEKMKLEWKWKTGDGLNRKRPRSAIAKPYDFKSIAEMKRNRGNNPYMKKGPSIL